MIVVKIIIMVLYTIVVIIDEISVGWTAWDYIGSNLYLPFTEPTTMSYLIERLTVLALFVIPYVLLWIFVF